ncbi:MAG TPA: 30S ribosomal protein S16 [Acidimicrobiia bacterium]|nr:30S ribosomal protein S16 [Acidimicrobiia bacterium]
MAVKIRLTRIGKKRQPSYRVVVADSRGPRDGRYIEQIGRYDPRQEPSLVEIDSERAAYWLARGAQPSPQAKKLIAIARGEAGPAPDKPRKVHVVGESAPVAAAEPAAVAAAAPAAEVIEVIEETAVEAATDEPVEEQP